jgi:hypothetical protein
MIAKQPKAARSVPRAVQIARILARPQYRGPLLAACVLLLAIVGFAVAWNRWGAPVTTGPDYVVTPDKIALTPQPEWIHANVKAEVVRAGSLTRLDLREPKLVEQIAEAFALHAWVAKVVRVEKRYPAEVTVEVEYRRPVAAVEITLGGQRELLFIDAESILLPSADFAQNQAQDYLRIGGVSGGPAGVYGAPWGDERVAEAAQIAAAIGERFKAARLYRILPAEASGGHMTYELRTAGETRVVWGAAPGRESANEPSAEHKIAALLALISDKGPLDRPGGERLIDLSRVGPARGQEIQP